MQPDNGMHLADRSRPVPGSVGGGLTGLLARDRRPEKMTAEVDLIRGALVEAQREYQEKVTATLVFDFSDMESEKGAAQEAIDRFPVINGLILSVAVYAQNGPKLLPNGHEIMFAANVMGPALPAELLLERLQEADGLVLHVIVPFHKEIDWKDLESIRNHRAMTAFNRTKTCNRAIAGELARRYPARLPCPRFARGPSGHSPAVTPFSSASLPPSGESPQPAGRSAQLHRRLRHVTPG